MKKAAALMLILLTVLTVCACSGGSGKSKSESKQGKTDINKLTEVRDWLVSDIWNRGICDMSFYYRSGKSSTGQTMDAGFAIEELEKAYAKRPEYDALMSSLSDEFSDMKEYYAKIMGQVEILLREIKKRGAEKTGEGLDTGLYNQYFDAFDARYYELRMNN